MGKAKEIGVVITGIGVVAPNGNNAYEYYKNCISGKTGIRFNRVMKDFQYMSEYVGEVELEEPLRWEDKFKHIGNSACDEMMKDAGLTKEQIQQKGNRAGICIASANVGSLRLEPQLRSQYNHSIRGIAHDLPNLNGLYDFNSTDCYYHFGERLGIEGPVTNVNAACASGTLAIGDAYRMVKTGKVDIAIGAGIDILSDLSLAGFNSMMNLSPKPCQPFDKNRGGITIGEGAAFILLEREDEALARGANIYGKIIDCVSMNEAYHVTKPHPSGSGALWCMENVLKSYDYNKNTTIYINTHGTSTQANDEMEVKAMENLVEKIGLPKVYFSSTKSLIGHCLGASGSLEFACSALGLKYGKMPISISVSEEMDYDKSKLTLVKSMNTAKDYDVFLSNSFAFAGNMVSIGVEKY